MIRPVDIQRASLVVLKTPPVARMQEPETVGFFGGVLVVESSLIGHVWRGRLLQLDALIGDMKGPEIADVGEAVGKLSKEFRRCDENEAGGVEEFLGELPDAGALPDVVPRDVEVFFVRRGGVYHHAFRGCGAALQEQFKAECADGLVCHFGGRWRAELIADMVGHERDVVLVGGGEVGVGEGDVRAVGLLEQDGVGGEGFHGGGENGMCARVGPLAGLPIGDALGLFGFALLELVLFEGGEVLEVGDRETQVAEDERVDERFP